MIFGFGKWQLQSKTNQRKAPQKPQFERIKICFDENAILKLWK